MATGTGSGKPDKALKEKQNKLTLMEKVLMRDKHDKHNKKDRESKATSRDLETVTKEMVAKEGSEGTSEAVGKTKTSLMDKVFMRDKTNKHNRKDRDSKVPSKDLDVAEGVAKEDEQVVAKHHKSSLMDKVFMRDRFDRISKRDRNYKARSKDLEEVKVVTKEESEETDSVAKLLSDVPKKVARKEDKLRVPGVDVFKSTSMGDLRHVDGSVQFRDRVDRSPRKKDNRRSSSSVVK